MQAKAMCTYGAATKVVFGLTALSLAAQAVRFLLMYFYQASMNYTVGVYGVVLLVLVPVTVLVINLMVVREVRRASNNATANLGVVQQSSTSSNSAVPSVMLVSISFLYLLLSAPHCALGVVYMWLSDTSRCSDAWTVTYQGYVVGWALMQPIYAYNFFVYLITGRHFRYKLAQLFRISRVRANAAAAAATDVDNDAHVKRRRGTTTAVSSL